jgi:hypothetical protein
MQGIKSIVSVITQGFSTGPFLKECSGSLCFFLMKIASTLLVFNEVFSSSFSFAVYHLIGYISSILKLSYLNIPSLFDQYSI